MSISVDQWKKQTLKCLSVAEELATALAGISFPGPSDPKGIALGLLARSMSNTHGTIVTIEHKLIVEARNLVRLVYENMFYVAALKESGEAFVKQLYDDDMALRKRRAQYMLEITNPDGKQDWEELLRSLLRKQKGSKPRKGLSPKDVAVMGPTRKGYIIYSQLCYDSGHPTTESLCRHIQKKRDPDNSQEFLELNYNAPATEEEICQTLEWLCSALIGVIIGVNEIFDGSSANGSINKILEQHHSMTSFNTFPQKQKNE